MQDKKYAMDLTLSDKIYYFTTFERKPLSKSIESIVSYDDSVVNVGITGICLSFKKSRNFKECSIVFVPDEQAVYFINEIEMLQELMGLLAGDIQKARQQYELLIQSQNEINKRIGVLSSK